MLETWEAATTFFPSSDGKADQPIEIVRLPGRGPGNLDIAEILDWSIIDYKSTVERLFLYPDKVTPPGYRVGWHPALRLQSVRMVLSVGLFVIYFSEILFGIAYTC